MGVDHTLGRVHPRMRELLTRTRVHSEEVPP